MDRAVTQNHSTVAWSTRIDLSLQARGVGVPAGALAHHEDAKADAESEQDEPFLVVGVIGIDGEERVLRAQQRRAWNDAGRGGRAR